MAGIVMSGGANKAIAGGVGMIAGAEFIEPILDWLVNDGLSRALEACCTMPIPETAQTGIVWLGLFGIGYLVSYMIPNKGAAS